MEGEEEDYSLQISDWERPFTDQELDAIEQAFQSASSSSSSYKDGQNCRKNGRLLPSSITSSSSDHYNSNSPLRISNPSSSLTPCRRNQHYSPYRSSFQAKSSMRYPKMSFGGHIIYSRDFSEVAKSANDILKIAEARKREGGHVILGFDIEWKPTFKRGVSPGKAAVMQICTGTTHCYVMHIIHSGIPQSLRSLLEDPTAIKVGVGIWNDAVKVLKDHNVSIKALEDLSSIANQKLGGDPKNWSLGRLTEMLVCKQLPKPSNIRLGNWEVDYLSKEQLQYAATDAFASWYIYEVLNRLPNAVDTKSDGREVPTPE